MFRVILFLLVSYLSGGRFRSGGRLFSGRDSCGGRAFLVGGVVVDRGISCGGQTVLMYVVVVLGVGLRWQIMVVVVSSSGGCGRGVK